MHCRHYLVTGRVQGVSFRRFTEKRALALKLMGWVRNLRDGRVEIIASGAEDKLKEFEDAISRGPILARVDGIERRDVSAAEAFSDFVVKDDGESPWYERH